MTELKQGCTYDLKIKITDSEGLSIAPVSVDKIEFVFGDVIKLFPSDDVSFDGVYTVSFSQNDTFRLHPYDKVQIRVKLKNGVVSGTGIQTVNVIESLSKEVL